VTQLLSARPGEQIRASRAAPSAGRASAAGSSAARASLPDAVFGCEKIFTDTASGKLADRPELDKALAYLREGDVLVITRLSRAMRSLKHLLALADGLRERGVGLVVLKQQIDTTTPGRLAGVPYSRRDR
jgi:DNA invertase Pin-like site-specific DNA recombinase